MSAKSFLILFTSAIAMASLALFSFLSCEKETLEVYQRGTKNSIPIRGTICGSIEEKDILNDNNDIIGNALLYNNTKNFYIEITLPDSLCIMNCYAHLSTSLYDFPLDSLQNLNYFAFNHVFRYTHLSYFKRIIIPLTELPNRSYMAVAIEYGKWENQELLKKIAWIDGIRFGSSIRGRITAFDKKQCLVQNGEAIDE
jgi:hypothetical protein